MCYHCEGASGGALGIGIGDRILMLENTWYSVISPESCSSILWHTWEHKEKAAEALRLTPQDMLQFKLIDEIVQEPFGGAHHDPAQTAATLKNTIEKYLTDLLVLNKKTLVSQRIQKFSTMGEFAQK